MLVHWIWFAHRPGLNDRDKMALLQHFRDPEDIYFADDGAFDAIGLSEDAKTALREKNLTSAEEILEACDREKLHILTCQDAAYPARLKNIADPPNVLYYKGRLPDFDGSPVIGVVGTRKASAYGLTTAKRMGYQIARCGGIVVSGMAYGIDGMAMSGALTAGAPAVGVLGCGADIVYPISNRALFRDTEEYGCILSEFAPGTPPAKWTFPKRNRIISGLSCGVLVLDSFHAALSRASEADKALMFYENEQAVTLKMALSGEYRTVSLLTGPEGGLEEKEVRQAREAGLQVCTLGKRILRCETAPLCALSAVMYDAGEF